jgi:hypothetical protein
MGRETVQLRGIATGHDVAATVTWLGVTKDAT